MSSVFVNRTDELDVLYSFLQLPDRYHSQDGFENDTEGEKYLRLALRHFKDLGLLGEEIQTRMLLGEL